MYDNHIAVHPLRRARRAAQIRDIRVGAFDVLNVVSGTAGGVFGIFLNCIRTPFWVLQSSTREGEP